MKYRVIDAERAGFSVERLCDVLDVSSSGYYAWKHRAASQRQRDDMVYLAHIRALFAASNGTYGSRHAGGVHCTTHAC